ncbi:FadR/GntR family transcriptional regulator [Leisingera sp. XS_AS12]|uniref:FadR/GntR family transcriptional regulator n=1 Tax=Leisingera sp. XS_AS12 TaxID=3241294 RepID=UPI003511C60D
MDRSINKALKRDSLNRSAKGSEMLETLGRRIVSGEYAVGETLPIEAELIEEFSVSRTTLREAIKTLTALGLLEVRPRHGTRVRPQREWTLLNRDVLRWMQPVNGFNVELSTAIDEAREVFEPAACALAAVRADRKEITRIRLAYEAMEQAAAEDDVPAAIQADKEFHLSILAATGNPILEAFDTAIDAVLGQLFRAAIEVHMESFRKNLVNHLRVLEAIEQGKPEEARQAMLDMISLTRRHLKNYKIIQPNS